jgi:hypothetical protein
MINATLAIAMIILETEQILSSKDFSGIIPL